MSLGQGLPEASRKARRSTSQQVKLLLKRSNAAQLSTGGASCRDLPEANVLL